MKWLVALLACIGIAQAQVIQHHIGDDSYAHVPLQFGFPLYGRIFTDSYMFSNGVVGFGSVNNHWCCSGHDLRNAQGYQFNFSIMPLQTDLINYQGRFLTEGTSQYQRYKWENISEYGVPNNLNTFSVEIRPSGYIGMSYEKVNISPWRPITIGITGDTNQGEYTQYYHGSGYSTNEPFNYITQSTGNQCLVNPLFSSSCAGYQEAYLTQQCSISALFSPQCANYAQAYLDQQCSLNPLYNASCQGYEQANHAYQCSVNPLYAVTCTDYQQAYLAQQCGISQLYSAQCPNYQQAYFNEQCRLNPLYNKDCSGYAEAYALSNIVPSSQIISTTAPSIQVDTSGTVSVSTPIIADPVVNEVVTRQPTIATRTENRTTSQPPSQPEKKEEKKEERKEERKEVKQPRTVNIEPKPTETAVGVVPTIKVADIPKGFDIMDFSHRKLIANMPTIKENPNMRWMMRDSDKRHREMVDEQWRK